MSDRGELREVVASLRAWLEWQGECRAEGLPPAPKAVFKPLELPRGPAAAPLPPPSFAAAPAAPPVQQRPSAFTPPPPAQRAPAFTPPPPAAAPAAAVETLEQIRADLGDCTRCRLHQGRTNIVFGVGNPRARLMFIGEGPGFYEDKEGEPFVGKAGELLDKMIAAMGLQRGEVYIANVVKCRPPNNRDPNPDEVAACQPFLYRQIQSVRPEVIVALGKPASHCLLGTDAAMGALRGRWHQLQLEPRTPVMPTWHPAYLLRNESAKKDAWQDLKQVMARLGLERPRA